MLKKRFSAGQNHFFNPSTPSKTPALEKWKKCTSCGGRWKKTICGRLKSLFQAPPLQGTSSRESWKHDFRPAKITFSSSLPPQGTSSRESWKNAFRPAKITFFIFFQAPDTSSGGRSGKSDFRPSKISFSSHRINFRSGMSDLFNSFQFQKQVNQAICWAYM